MNKTMSGMIALLCATCSLFGDALIPSDAERIIESKTLPPKALAVQNWKPDYPGQILVVDGGKYGGTTTLKFNENHGGLKQDYFPYVYFQRSLLNGIRLKLNLPPETYNRFNQLSFWIYPDKEDRATLWFDMSGSGRWTQACCPMKPKQWNKVSVCWSQHTPEEARKINSAVLSRQRFGRLPGDPEWSVFYLKDLTLENVVIGTEKGWTPSPEKIIIPQTGFAPNYDKTAILNPNHKDNDFQVLRHGKPVFTGKLQLKTYPTGTFKIADFSDLKTPGLYRVKSGNLISSPFLIATYHLKELTEKTQQFLFSVRSGMATPAHPTCFLDDCIRSDNKKPMNVSGGWFDASDLREYHSMAMTGITRPLSFACLYNVDSSLYDEATWGIKQLVKLYDEKTGLPVTVHSLYPIMNPDKRLRKIYRIGHFYKANNYWTDNKTGTGDERVIHIPTTYVCHPDLQDNHWGMTVAGAYYKLIAKEQDKALAEQTFKKCQRHFDFMKGKNPKQLKESGIGWLYPGMTHAVALLLENATTLYQLTQRKDYLDMAREQTRCYLVRQQKQVFVTKEGFLTGYFRDSHKGHNGTSARISNMGVLAMARLAPFLTKDDPKLFFRIHAAIRLYVDFFLKNPNTKVQPYGSPYLSFTDKKHKTSFKAELGYAMGKPECKLYASTQAGFLNGPAGAAAIQTQGLAAFLHEPELQQTAASYLTFHTGFNPFGRSLIADIGANHRHDIMSSVLGWIPGMMSNTDWENGVPKLPYNRHHGMNEIYSQCQAVYGVGSAMLSAPAKLTIKLANCPANATLTIRDQSNGKNVKTLTILRPTQVIEIPGGVTYDFRFSHGPTFIVPVLNSEIRTLDWDLDNCFQILAIDLPKTHLPSAKLNARVKVRYWGAKPQTITLCAKTEGMKLDKETVALTVKPGELATFDFPGTAPKDAGTPFVFMTYPQGQLNRIRTAAALTIPKP